MDRQHWLPQRKIVYQSYIKDDLKSGSHHLFQNRKIPFLENDRAVMDRLKFSLGVDDQKVLFIFQNINGIGKDFNHRPISFVNGKGPCPAEKHPLPKLVSTGSIKKSKTTIRAVAAIMISPHTS
ncbi:MAG: hypothetical protein PHD25_06085 [Bacteroidales bacterium]|nr:hypothetical protein [Bacteroidales bacterium]